MSDLPFCLSFLKDPVNMSQKLKQTSRLCILWSFHAWHFTGVRPNLIKISILIIERPDAVFVLFVITLKCAALLIINDQLQLQGLYD